MVFLEGLVVRFKQWVQGHFEALLAGTLLLVAFLTNFVTPKLAFINVYFLPVLVAGYILGRRSAVLAGFLSVLLEVLRNLVVSPRSSSIDLWLHLTVWGGFLLIAGYVVGSLYEERQKKIEALKTAYIGVIEILTKYIESVDDYTKGHSVRVSALSLEICKAMGLSREECENIRVAGLLHDVGKIQISTDLIQKAAALTVEERHVMGTHAEKGANLLSSVGEVLQEAVPMILAHHEYYCMDHDKDPALIKQIPLGSRIVAVADAYDAIVTDRPYRKGKPPWQALEEIKQVVGNRFDPQVVEAFQRVIGKLIDHDERDTVPTLRG